MVGVHHRSGTFIDMGGGTPPQWNVYREGGYTTSVEHLSTGRGGGGGGHHLSGIFL